MLKLNKFLLGAVGLALFISGCATTSSPDDLGKLEYTGFSEKSDGTTYQSVMGLSCPAEIDGMTRGSAVVYNEGGTDVSCNYVDEDRVFTTYLSRYSDDTLTNNFRSSQYHLENRLTPEGYVFDEELSDSCSSKSIDTASLLSGLSGILSGEATRNEITISPSPSAVYVTNDSMSLVVVEEMFEKEFFKVRFTGPYSGASSVEGTCKLIRDTFLSIQQDVKENRGIELSDDDKLLKLLNSKSES